MSAKIDQEQERSPMHEQILIECDGQRAEVDVGIAPLVLALWQHGYRTIGSCEAFPVAGGRAYVAFPPEQADQAETFRRLVGPEAVVVEATGEDVAAVQARGGKPDVPVGTVGVLFPPARIPALLQKVTA